MSQANVDIEERQETGAAWMIIGAICWLVAFIAMFFHPAAWKLGLYSIMEYAGVLSFVGTVVFIFGWRVRKKASQ